MRRGWVGLMVFIVATGTMFVGPGSAAREDARPGDLVRLDDTPCTLGFLFDGAGPHAGTRFFTTAAHCTDHIGQTAVLNNDQRLGEVAFIGARELDRRDYALIEVDAGVSTDPAVLGILVGQPNGYVTAEQATAGDIILLSGWGFGFSDYRVTRQNRGGVLTFINADVYAGYDVAYFGDSGAPVVHQRTGAALGLISGVYGLVIDYGQSEGARPGIAQSGPTVEAILRDAAANGFPLTLA